MGIIHSRIENYSYSKLLLFIAITRMGFTKNNHLRSGIRYANALRWVIIFIGTPSTCSNLFNSDLTVHGPPPATPRLAPSYTNSPYGNVQTCWLWITYGRQAGGWHPSGFYIKIQFVSLDTGECSHGTGWAWLIRTRLIRSSTQFKVSLKSLLDSYHFMFKMHG